MRQNRNITIEKLFLTETGTYNDMPYRPLKANADLESIRNMQEVTQGGMYITPATVAGVAGGILRPSSEIEGISTIANGWGNARFRFMMEVVVNQGPGTTTRHILSGYTDHHDVSFRKTLDPNMRLYINGGVKINQSMATTPTGNQVYTRPIESYQLLTGSYAPSWNQQGGGIITQSMRPEDVFCSISKSILGNNVTDYRSSFAMNAKKSRRSNNLAPTHLATTLKAHTSATAAAHDTTDDFQTLMENARGFVIEDTVGSDDFLSFLGRNSSFNDESSISYSELLSMDPTLEGRVLVSELGQTYRNDVHRTGQTEYWTSSTQETVIATILSQSIPAMMSELLLPKVSFWATNQTMDGSYDVRILSHAGFSTAMDMTPQLITFMDRIRTELLRDITRNNQIGINITVDADIMGDIKVSVSMNNNPTVDYNTPVFCDALFSSVITNTPNGLDRMASAVGDIAENLSVQYSDNQNNQGVIENAAGSLI